MSLLISFGTGISHSTYYTYPQIPFFVVPR